MDMHVDEPGADDAPAWHLDDDGAGLDPEVRTDPGHTTTVDQHVRRTIDAVDRIDDASALEHRPV